MILQESSPLLAKLGTGDDLTEDSMDAPPSVGSDSGPATSVTPAASVSHTPSTTKKPIKCFQKRMVTGYIIYSGEVRKSIAAKNPEATFGEVSRMVGNEWRNLPAHMKSEYEEKSQRLNEETAAEMARNGGDPSSSSAPGTPSTAAGSHADVIYECCWQKCPWQYEDINDLTDHLLQEPNGHVQSTVNTNDSEFQCMWRGCSRIRKGVPPFPKMERLLRHIREVHIQKNQGRVVCPADRSKFFVYSKKTARIAPATGSSVSQTHESPPMGHNNAANAPRQCGFEPMFVAVPPKPQRLLHSDAYIKYIEGLHSQSRYISNWDKSMRAHMDHSSIPDVSRLPTHWLASHSRDKSNGTAAEVVSTLWSLRDYMMKDALNISKMLH